MEEGRTPIAISCAVRQSVYTEGSSKQYTYIDMIRFEFTMFRGCRAETLILIIDWLRGRESIVDVFDG